MSPLIAVIALSVLLALAVVAAVFLWTRNRRATRRMATLNREMLEASRDASVGRRLSIPRDPDSAQFASTVNRLFDALGERDEKIQGRDKLFKDFARTLLKSSSSTTKRYCWRMNPPLRWSALMPHN